MAASASCSQLGCVLLRFEDTQKEADKYVFRASMLRNIAKTGPYFHDGSVTQLNKAVQIMADVQLGVALTEDDTKNSVEFLGSLTGGIPAHFSHPDDSKQD